jgi:hypothetical protein
MSAGEHDIDIEIGATFFLNVTWEDENGDPIDLTGYDARMQIRKKYSSSTTIMSFTTGAGTITLGGAAGTIAVKGLATVTEDVTDKYGVYDLEMIAPNTDVYRILKGNVNFDPEATR